MNKEFSGDSGLTVTVLVAPHVLGLLSFSFCWGPQTIFKPVFVCIIISKNLDLSISMDEV
jgi:hypothetical protein